MCTVRIVGERSEYLSISIQGRERPDSADYWDANWLVCSVEVAAGAFRGGFDSSLRTDELEHFHRQLERLHEKLVGDAELVTMEGWLGLRLIGDSRGHVEASGRLCDDLSSGNSLEFRLRLDQTFLPPLLRQLSAAMDRFPVIQRESEHV